MTYSIQHCGPDYYVCSGAGTVCAAYDERDACEIKQALELLPLVRQMLNVARNAYWEGNWTVREWLIQERTARAVQNALDSARADVSAPALALGGM